MKIKTAIMLFIISVFLVDCRAAVGENDSIEKLTGLKKIEGDNFITDLKYNSEDNFLKKNVYAEFGINQCYVRPELYSALMSIAPKLEKMKFKLIFYDCYRPVEVQKAMWKILPDSKYVANPVKGSAHNRGIAIDCALADERGNYLEFPTGFDSFEEKAWQSYQCGKEEYQKCVNREILSGLLKDAGLVPTRTEWWHYQLPDAKKYPLIPLNGGKKDE